MAGKWAYSENQWRNKTKKSIRNKMKLSVAHDGKLLAATIAFPLDADYAMMYTRYHAQHLIFLAAYNTWVAAGGLQTADTMSLDELFSALKISLNAWVVVILGFYIVTSIRYKAIMAGGRKVYNRGAIDDRIQAVSSLSTRIGSDVNLVATKALVDGVYTGLIAARNNQTGGKESNNSSNANSQGNGCMDLQYADCGVLMNKFYLTPISIEAFFDRELLANKMQMIFTATMNGTEKKELSERTVLSDDIFRFKLDSGGLATVSATAYLGSTPGAIDSSPVTILNHLEHKGTFADFGITDYSLHRYVTIV